MAGHQQDRGGSLLGQGKGQIVKQIERGLVGRVEIVDDHHERLVLGQADQSTGHGHAKLDRILAPDIEGGRWLAVRSSPKQPVQERDFTRVQHRFIIQPGE